MIPLIHLENNRLHSFFLKFIESFLNFQRRMMVEAFLTLVQVPPNILLKTRMVRERDSVRLSNARNLDFAHTFSPSKCKPQPHKGPTCPPRLSPRATSRTPRTPRSSHCSTQTSRRSLVAIPGQRVRPSRRPGGWSPPVQLGAEKGVKG